MKSIITMLLVMVTTSLVAQQEDLTYLSSGGKLKPLQAIMDIRHYDVTLDVDIANTRQYPSNNDPININ
jgi:hypothetical protein